MIDSLNKAAGESGFHAERVLGKVIEDRGSQVTFSALGQQAPLAEKEKWDPDFVKRKKIAAILKTLIPEFSGRRRRFSLTGYVAPICGSEFLIKMHADGLVIKSRSASCNLMPSWVEKTDAEAFVCIYQAIST